MTSLLSHISAFKYWRHVGTPGFIVPEPSRTTIAPPNFAVSDFDWLVNTSVLSRPLHGLTSVKHKRTNEPAVRHVAYQELPFGSVCSISPEQRITSPELTIIQIAPLLSFTELVCIICEFCGLFTINESLENPLIKRAPLTSVAKIAAFCQRAKGLTGVAKAAKATKYAHDRSRSPMETATILLFTLPQQRGGYSLSGARLNRKITLSPKARKMAGIDRLEPDIAWPKAKIIVEYDSKAFHNQEARISNDARRKNAFTTSGFQVITLTSSQLNSKTEMDKIAAHIAAAAKKRVRIAKPATFYAKQKLLRMELLHCDGVHRKQHTLSERAGQQVERAITSLSWLADDDLA